jgi:hypothetical protein
VEKGIVKLKYLPTDKMVADSLTKRVPNEKFIWCRARMGLASARSRKDKDALIEGGS